MDNKKIGGLIAAQRKEMELTQKELGQRLHVSDRAVSKWERGLNLPDAALFQPLCRELDITVTELLRGEREPPTVSQLEQMVSDTVTLAQKKERGGRKYRWIAAVLAAALALSLWPWLRRSWQQRRDQAYFDLDTTPAAVSVHYRDAALSIDISLLSGGPRMPRVSGGSRRRSRMRGSPGRNWRLCMSRSLTWTERRRCSSPCRIQRQRWNSACIAGLRRGWGRSRSGRRGRGWTLLPAIRRRPLPCRSTAIPSGPSPAICTPWWPAGETDTTGSSAS